MTWVNEAIEVLKNSHPDSKVYVGCDSIRFKEKRSKRWKARYSTVIIIHEAGSKGCKLFHNSEVMDDYGNLKMRLMNEVSFAIVCAGELVDHLDGRYMEVHLDINGDPKHKSNVAMAEAIGYVRGSGFVPKIKPEAFAANHVADHVCREKLSKAPKPLPGKETSS